MTPRSFLVPLALVALGCSSGSDSTGPDKPIPLGPTNVIIVTATATSVQLQNTGDAGAYKLEVWGRRLTNTPSGCFTSQKIDGRCPEIAEKLTEFEPVTVLAKYSETIGINPNGNSIYAYKVSSRPTNTAFWTQTACLQVVTGGWLTFKC